MRLNSEQAKHVAETLRIIAIAEFGFFGYTGGLEHRDWLFVALSVGVFAILEGAAILTLRERA